MFNFCWFLNMSCGLLCLYQGGAKSLNQILIQCLLVISFDDCSSCHYKRFWRPLLVCHDGSFELSADEVGGMAAIIAAQMRRQSS